MRKRSSTVLVLSVLLTGCLGDGTGVTEQQECGDNAHVVSGGTNCVCNDGFSWCTNDPSDPLFNDCCGDCGNNAFLNGTNCQCEFGYNWCTDDRQHPDFWSCCEIDCEPDCYGRECGPSGCGGTCLPGCADGQECSPNGLCDCTPDCAGRECGPDGCGGQCSPGCGATTACSEFGLCECIPDCFGRECGPDGCGGQCSPGCSDTSVCNESGLCECIPDCSGRECGSDGCWGECLPGCDVGEVCNMIGRCDCAPQCSGRECGPDGCGGQCSPGCSVNEVCNANGRCDCVPQCGERECGSDGCGSQCTPGCLDDEACIDGVCECAPQCEDRECGPDTCGSTCEPGCEADEECATGGTCRSICGLNTVYVDGRCYCLEDHNPCSTAAEDVDCCFFSSNRFQISFFEAYVVLYAEKESLEPWDWDGVIEEWLQDLILDVVHHLVEAEYGTLAADIARDLTAWAMEHAPELMEDYVPPDLYFVIFQGGEEIGRSNVVQDSYYAVWTLNTILVSVSESTPLTVQVRDEDLLLDDLVQEFQLDLDLLRSVANWGIMSSEIGNIMALAWSVEFM